MMVVFLVFSVLLVLVGGSLLVSKTNFDRQRAFLKRPLELDEHLKAKITESIGLETGGGIAMSAYDVLSGAARIDPKLLEGINHLHHAKEFSNFKDLLDYMQQVIIGDSAIGSDAWQQLIHKYKGFAGEEYVAEWLRDAGHAVTMPLSGTEPGYDMIVDGKEFNVKITRSPDYIMDHLEKYPDVDVITNREMMEHFSDHPRVLIDENLSILDLETAVEGTLEELAGYGAFDIGSGLLILAVSGLQNANRVRKKEIDIKSGLEFTAIETAGAGIGLYTGRQLGFAVGASLAPVTGGLSLVVAPIIGSLIGAMAGRNVGSWVKSRHLRSFINEFRDASASHAETFIHHFHTIVLRATSDIVSQQNVAVSRIQTAQPRVLQFLFPNVETTFWKLFHAELKVDESLLRAEYQKLYDGIINASDKSLAGAELYARGVGFLYDVKPVVSTFKEVDQAAHKVAKEKQRLFPSKKAENPEQSLKQKSRDTLDEVGVHAKATASRISDNLQNVSTNVANRFKPRS